MLSTLNSALKVPKPSEDWKIISRPTTYSIQQVDIVFLIAAIIILLLNLLLEYSTKELAIFQFSSFGSRLFPAT